MRLWFDHGLGDCVHFAHLLQLYRNRGYDISVHYEANKALVWQAAGIEYAPLEGARYHHWGYPEGFNQPNAQQDFSGSKIAGNFNLSPLPYLGGVQDAWAELLRVDLDGSVEPHLPAEAVGAAQRFLQHLPRPIVLLHTAGTNFPEAKNIAPHVSALLYRTLLDSFDGSLILLDWDNRVPAMAHGRVRHLKRDWGHIDLYCLAALMQQASLLIGIDSGPFHFAAMTRLPALGIFHQHYPSCVTLPRACNVYMARATRTLNAARRQSWNIVEYSGDQPTASEIATQALRMLGGSRYGMPLGRDVMVQQWIRDWCRGSLLLDPKADRHRSLDALLRIAAPMVNPQIVETGCIRSQEDWAGAGNSTYIFGAWLDGRKSGGLTSIDIDPDHCALARDATHPWADHVTVTQADSVSWLRQAPHDIDMLYIDSLDVDDPAHAQHGLAEIKAAEPRLSPRALVAFDDTSWDGGWSGKGALGVPYLLDRGWKLKTAGYQVVLSRDSNS